VPPPPSTVAKQEPAASSPSTTAPPEASSPARRLSLRTWEAIGLAILTIGAVVGFLVYPTYPNYDSVYSLLWGRELLHLDQLSFEAYRAPTEHPLAIAFGAALSLLGDGAGRVMVAFTVASFVALAAGVYALGKTAFGPLVGFAAAGLLVTRFDFPFLAARGYIDVPYLAVVIWAAVIEARAPRRHPVAVSLMLAGAGMMRPEAWLLAALYWLWLFPPSSWPQRVRYAVLASLGPLVWATTDFLVTGDPKFSLTSTSELAEELGRAKGLSAVPDSLYSFLIKLAKFPVVMGGIAGFALALVLAPKRLGMPLVLFAVGVGTFSMVGVAGLSIIDRYLLVPSLCVMIFAAVALAGWTMLEPGTPWRRLWAGAAAALLIFGVVFTATRVNLSKLDSELRFRGDSHAALSQLLDDPAVSRALPCGPVYVPNHKLVPDVRWQLDRDRGDVLARSSDEVGTPRRGVVILVHERIAMFKQALVSEADDPIDNLPPPGFTRAATSRYYAAYVRC
jgi:hypothetical protein